MTPTSPFNRMPAVDLARLKKQTALLVDQFDHPPALLGRLHEILDYYVNCSLRTHKTIAQSSNLPTYRTPAVVLRYIETDLSPLAAEYPEKALSLADELWDAGYLETRLLAAFLLGCIQPQEERLLARLTAWTRQIRDPSVRATLLSTSLTRLRKETPDLFLTLVKEWLHPARIKLWSNGIQALLPLITSPGFENFPPIFETVKPVIEVAPPLLQTDIEELILALYNATPMETIHFLRQVLNNPQYPQALITMRRIFPSFPLQLRENLQDLMRSVK